MVDSRNYFIVAVSCSIFLDCHCIAALNLPTSLTLDGFIAIPGTLNRTFLIAPVDAIISQEAWL